MFRVWGSRALVRDTFSDKLSSRAIPCVFLGFPLDGPRWQLYHPTSRHLLPSQDVTFDELVPFHSLFLYRTAPLPPPPPPLFLTPGPPPVSQVDLVEPVKVAVDSGAAGGGAARGVATGGAARERAEPKCAEPWGAEPGAAEFEGADPGNAEPELAELRGAGLGGAEPKHAEPGGTFARAFEVALLELGGRELEALELLVLEVLELLVAEVLVLEVLELLEPVVLQALELETLELEPLELEVPEVLELLAPEVLELIVLEVLEVLEALRVPRHGVSLSLHCSCASGLLGAGFFRVALLELGGLELDALQVLVLEVLELLEPVVLQALELETLELEPLVPKGLVLEVQEPLELEVLQALELEEMELELLVVLLSLELETLELGPIVVRLLATIVTDHSFESTAASALVAKLVDFATACHLDYAPSLVAESESVCPPSVRGECALGTDVLKDRQEEFECFAAAVPHFLSLLIAPKGNPDAPDIPTPRSYAEAIMGPYSPQWQTAMDAEMASWKSICTYVDEVPLHGANIVDGTWMFRVKRPPGSPPVFKARYVARGFSQRQTEPRELNSSRPSPLPQR
ncbi:unnamed protein product [Closterium sp. NIES-64]|nr:unnamed protein product [Closterium sp. NIES-64]